MCYLPKSRNGITLVRRINFAYNTILVSGSESSHSRVTRVSYNYDLESNGSFGHHVFHIKTRSSAEHNQITNRERSKWFSRVFPTWLAITVTYIALYIWWLVVHLKTAINSRVLPLQGVLQTLGHCHLFTLLADEIPSAIHSVLAC